MADAGDENDALCRPLFFDRQNLTANDLNALIEWIRERTRRHNRHLVGWGVVCGLEVERVDDKPWQVRVGRGFAVMPSGEEVAVPDEAPPHDVCAEARACLDIPGSCPAPLDLGDTGTPPDHDSGSFIAFALPGGPTLGPNPLAAGRAAITVIQPGAGSGLPTRAVEINGIPGLDLGTDAVIELDPPTDMVRMTIVHGATRAVVVARNAAGEELDRQSPTATDLQPETLTIEGSRITRIELGGLLSNMILTRLEFVPLPRGQVYLALCPAEAPSGFRPGIPEHCRPAGNNLFPSRICETYALKVLCGLPDRPRPVCETIDRIVCGPEHLPCHDPGDGEDCIVIAALTIGDDGIMAIDEFTHRRRVLPLALIGDLAACHCGADTEPPSTQPTRPTMPTIFSPPPTRLTDPTRLSVFTIVPEFTRFSDLVVSGFTNFTPSLFTNLTRGPIFSIGPDRPIDPVDPIDLRPIDFDPTPGERIDLGSLTGVGGARAGRLRGIGVNNLADFVGRGSQELATTLGMSEVSVAGMQEEARLIIERNR